MELFNGKVEICDKCQEKFFRKWNNARRSLSSLNDISYWTENRGWKNYNLLCRSCLKDWKNNFEKEWENSIGWRKKSVFRRYIETGQLEKDDKI